MVKDCVTDVVGGINSTVFVYGQTGSGKTYTMLGTEQNKGVGLLAV